MHSLAQEVTQPGSPRNLSDRKTKPKLYEFTRHPKEYARVGALPLQACARFVLETLVRFAGKTDWLCWLSVAEIARINPRSARHTSYSTHHVNRALRQLRALGLVSWERVRCLSHYPARDAKTKEVRRGEGRFTQGGGRIWRVEFEKIRAFPLQCFRAPTTGTNLAGAIMQDLPGSIPHDRPSISGSPSENMDPAAGAAARGRSPAREASETPSAARAKTAPPGAQRRAEGEKVASETPSSADASSAQRRGQGPSPDVRARREGGDPPAAPPPELVTSAQLRDFEAEMRRSWGFKGSHARRSAVAAQTDNGARPGVPGAFSEDDGHENSLIGPERKRVT